MKNFRGWTREVEVFPGWLRFPRSSCIIFPASLMCSEKDNVGRFDDPWKNSKLARNFFMAWPHGSSKGLNNNKIWLCHEFLFVFLTLLSWMIKGQQGTFNGQSVKVHPVLKLNTLYLSWRWHIKKGLFSLLKGGRRFGKRIYEGFPVRFAILYCSLATQCVQPSKVNGPEM